MHNTPQPIPLLKDKTHPAVVRGKTGEEEREKKEKMRRDGKGITLGLRGGWERPARYRGQQSTD